jgi:pimeloyl-ACP methyl ester carboxylesterase
MHPSFRWIAPLLLLGALLLAPSVRADDKACAVVVLHGKWGTPQGMSIFASRLDPPCTARTIEMPWSKRRDYDADYPHAVREIAAAVRDFRDRGFHRVLVAGQSFGANAVLAYGAEVGDVDGLIALAPGHAPRPMYMRGITRSAVDEARRLVQEGKGDESVSIVDVNQGQRRTIRMKASVALTYFDPQGWGVMETTIARLTPGIPLLMVAATGDPGYAHDLEMFELAPKNPASRVVTVQADHFGTPDAALPAVREWLKTLVTD